jgi:hypothetical protein
VPQSGIRIIALSVAISSCRHYNESATRHTWYFAVQDCKFGRIYLVVGKNNQNKFGLYFF